MVFHFVHFSAQCLWRLGQETLEEAAAQGRETTLDDV
jgi:hypothetical protein